jgi:hypothetical protein
MRRDIFTSLIVVAGAVAGCVSSGTSAVAEACTSTTDCALELECVAVDDGKSFCLPRPPGREERACQTDTDCTLSDGQLWPVEAECLDGACRCLGAEILCVEDPFDGDGFSVILEEESCRCLNRGNEGDDCITSHTCGPGLACTNGECRDGRGLPGTACFSSTDCNGDACDDFRDGNDVGVCL